MARHKGGLNNKYTLEFKLEVIEFNKQHGPNETTEVYGVVKSVFYKWEKIYLEEGIEGLSIERRGRPIKDQELLAINSKKFPNNVKEDLIAENQRLKMEIDYLKKLTALIHEKEKIQKKSK